MGFNHVPAGKNLPQDFNVIIEIPMHGAPIKYEVDKESGVLFVDRFMGTSMHYPCNYGYIPQTLSADGDPVDVLCITPIPLALGVVIRARAIGVLKMSDESGQDAKVIAVPIDKICPMTAGIKTLEDIPELLRRQLVHFFEHYKDLETGKWVKIEGWGDIKEAEAEILSGLNAKKS